MSKKIEYKLSETTMEILVERGHDPEVLKTAFKVARTFELNQKKQSQDKPIVSSDHQPCSDCGGIFFLRSGTCFTCQTCGTSQGCS